ncbi:YihY/virulence factor BrkB family protein [Polymorphobacter sp.]|uniref:YihY/virulence factor BrkB family protein n=1 Tax=Polymorphobacter sp. TaxID=1909290 RepID=UPI003F6EA9D3
MEALGAAIRGTWQDGPSHAGNLAYLSLLCLFPFFILVITVAGIFGRTEDGMRVIINVLAVLPRSVAALLNGPVTEVIAQRASGGLLTLGIIVILWTVTSYAEAVRDIIRRAHGTERRMPLWRYRALSLAVVFAGVFLMLAALAAQLLLTGTEAIMRQLLPAGRGLPELHFALRQLLPVASLFGGLCVALYGLTASGIRRWTWIWPGALVITLGWTAVTAIMPALLSVFGRSSLTYGSLAGVIVALIYFWVLGLWLIFGVHFNAALAKPGQSRLKANPRQ